MSAAAAQRFISEVWGLQGTAYLVVALRYFARVKKFGWGVLGWEDFVMVLATVSGFENSNRPASTSSRLVH